MPYLLPFDEDGLPTSAELGSRWLLLFGHGNAYWVGNYSKALHHFTPARPGPPQVLDPGSYYSINAALFDHAGPMNSLRRLAFGWVTGGTAQPYWSAQAHSLLREVTLHRDGIHMLQHVAPEVEKLRRTHLLHSSEEVLIEPNSTGHVSQAAYGDVLEIQATFEPQPSHGIVTALGVTVRGDAVGVAERMSYYPASAEVASGGLSGPEKRSRVLLPQTRNITLRIFVDRSVGEVYCGGAAITARLFPLEPLKATVVDIFADGGSVKLLALDVWEMGPMWAEGSDK